MKRQLGKQEIADLLNKFMAGETSLDEENILAQYFRTHEVSDEWKEYKEMFALFDGGMVEVSLPLSPSKGRGTQSRFSSLSLWRGRGVRLVGAIAASIIVAFFLWPNSPAVVEQQPIVAEVVEQPDAEPLEASEVSDYSDYSDYSESSDNSDNSDNSNNSEFSEPVKPKGTNKPRKVSKPAEEPLLAETEPVVEPSARNSRDNHEERLYDPSNPYLLATAQLQDLRSRGERLDREVTMLLHH